MSLRFMVESTRTLATKTDRAHRWVKTALKDGLLVRGPCEICGAEPTHAHHDDYDKPLEVRWLCRPHHRVEHGLGPSPETVDLANKLKRARSDSGLTQVRVADLLDVTSVAVSRWERGVSGPTVSHLAELAELYEVPLTWFFEKEAA